MCSWSNNSNDFLWAFLLLLPSCRSTSFDLWFYYCFWWINEKCQISIMSKLLCDFLNVVAIWFMFHLLVAIIDFSNNECLSYFINVCFIYIYIYSNYIYIFLTYSYFQLTYDFNLYFLFTICLICTGYEFTSKSHSASSATPDR